MKKLIVPMLLAGLILAWLAAPASAAQNAQVEKKPQKGIPKEIGELMLEGLKTKQPRLDIPFEIFKNLLLPGKESIFNVIFLKIKNSSLGFTTIAGLQNSSLVNDQNKMKSGNTIYTLIHKVENGIPSKIWAGFQVPIDMVVDANGYNPDSEDWYAFGMAIPPGEYIATIALVSPDRKKIGIQYFNFTLPDPKSFTSSLDTFSVFILKEAKERREAEASPELHREFFAYGGYDMIPNINNELALGDNLDIFFVILGAQPKDAQDRQSYDIDLNMKVFEGDKLAINWAPANYKNTLISFPLPLKQTIEKKEQKKEGDKVIEEKVISKETRDLPHGSYTLILKITDKVTNFSCEKRLDFSIK